MTRTQRRWLTSWVSLSLLGWALSLATPLSCARRAEPTVEGAIDPALLAFLSRARAAHHRADLLESDDLLEPAARELSAIVDGPLPPSGASLPEVREVLADTLARRADLSSRLGRHDAAAADVDRGLSLATEISYFRGHLFEVQGLVEERRASHLRREAERLLERADARAADAARASLEELVAARDLATERADAAGPDEVDAARSALAAANVALRSAREATLDTEERTRLDALTAAAQAATERALAAFARAIAVQGQVIEESLSPAATDEARAPP